MPPPHQAQPSDQEGRILLAIQAFKSGQFRSMRACVKAYDVPYTSFYNRLHELPLRRDTPSNTQRLTSQEELAIIQYILDLDSRGFPPRPATVREMADLLLSERDAPPVGKNWTSTFIKRRTEIKTKFSRKYDYKRAQCEDPIVLGDWFRLVRNTITKYGIVEEDIYNFDEAGFLMGVIATAKVVTGSESRNRPKTAQPGNREWVSIIQGINSCGWALPPFIIFKGQYHLSAWYEDSGLPQDWVITLSENGWTTNEIGFEWIQHFDKHTKGRTVGRYRLLVLDGHESHISVQFQQYCQENSIITLCMPPHSSHILQPLDVGCFSPLKALYGKQIENLVRVRIQHITKLEFLPAFKVAFNAAFIEQNIKSGFRATGLVPYNPENVLSHLDLRLKTPTPPPTNELNWTPKTPQNAIELEFQTTYLKNRIVQHQDSSPTSINEAFDRLTKGAQIMIHGATLMRAEIKALQEANQLKKRRERKKKRRIYQGGSLTVEEGEEIVQSTQIQQEEGSNNTQRRCLEGKRRRCGLCNQVGHNARTCEAS